MADRICLVAVVDGPVGNFSYDVLRWVFNAAIRRPVLRRQLVADVERRAGAETRRRRLARLLLSDEALALVYDDNAAGMGLLLGPAVSAPVEPQVLGRAALDAVRAQADRTIRLGLAQLDQGRSLQDGQGVLLEGLEALKDGQSVIFERLCDALEAQAGVTTLVADPRASEFRASELVGRDDDIDRLWGEITAPSTGYVVVAAGPWAGKTALLAEMVADPAPGVDLISFFIRAVGQRNSAEHFLDVVNGQLRRLLDRRREPALDLAGRRAEFEALWPEAVTMATANERRLVLLVDGLDEQNDHAEVPISALLPVSVGDWARVVVATRPNPRRHPEMSSTHPYYLASQHPVELAPSPAARKVAEHAGDAVRAITQRGEDQTRQALGLLTVADGPLTAADLAALVNCDSYGLDRALVGLERHLVGDGSQDRPWELGHVELLNTARKELARLGGFLEECEARIDRWADNYHQAGWASDTPAYFLATYPGMLARRRLPRRLAWLVSDEYEVRVRERLRTRRGLIDAIDAGLGLYGRSEVALESDDVWAICTFGLRRSEMLATTCAIAPSLIADWADLGSWDEVHRLLDQITTDIELVEAIGAAATTDLTPHAESVLLAHAGRAQHPHASSTAQEHVASALARQAAHDPEALPRAQQIAEQISHPGRRSDALVSIANACSDQDRTIARDVLRRAQEAAGAVDDLSDKTRVLLGIAEALVLHDADAAQGAWCAAEETADQIYDADARGPDLAAVAVSVATRASVDADALTRALRIVDRINEFGTNVALRRITENLAAEAPQNARMRAVAERIAASIDDPDNGYEAWLAVARSLGDSAGAEAFARAKRLAYGIENPLRKTRALATLAKELAPDDIDAARTVAADAEQIAGTIDDPLDKDDALESVVYSLAALAKNDSSTLAHAIDLADTIEDALERSRALARIATLEPEDLDTVHHRLAQAEHAADLAAAPWAQPETLTAIVEALAVRCDRCEDNLSRAEQIADAIDHPPTKSEAWSRIAAATATHNPQAAKHAVARAQRAAASIEDPRKRGEALTAIARALAIWDSEAACETLVRAEAIAASFEDPLARGKPLTDIAHALAMCDAEAAWEMLARAQTIAESLGTPRGRCMALLDVAEATPNDDVDATRALLTRARQAADHISEPSARDSAVEAIVQALAKRAANDPDGLALAQELANTIGDPTSRYTALLETVRSLAINDVPRAQEVILAAEQAIAAIDDMEETSAGLTMLASVLTRIDLDSAWDALARARQAVELITNRHARGDAMATTISVQAAEFPSDPEQLAAAEQLAELIHFPPTKCEALVNVADALARPHLGATYAEDPRPASARRTGSQGQIDAATTREEIPQAAWALLARLARGPGFDHSDVFPALIRLGGSAAGRAVADRVLRRPINNLGAEWSRWRTIPSW